MRSRRAAWLHAAGVAFVAAADPWSARADDAAAIELGARAGYALPFGGLGSYPWTLSDAVVGVVPIWLDASWRFNSHLVAGAYFQYGVGTVNGHAIADCGTSGSCSASDVLVGLQLQYHPLGDARVDPWVGIGAGYEALDYTALGGGQWSYGFKGVDVAALHVGADFRPTRNLSIGPFVLLTVGHFLSCSAVDSGYAWPCTPDRTNTHEWLTFGLRGAYDIRVAR